ncbi:MAG TPA: magnesium transporter CorA family protein [Dehalococcoidales bacterium]|jgi:magnesium transporter|nr:magnesium transporter CorA family protein [Dehalococcoidales bacterium]
MARTTTGKEPQLHVESLTWEDVTWVNIEGPTERETEYLAQNYPFHPLDLDDCLSRIQRPKIDEYEEYLFLVFHFPVFNKKTRVTTPSQVSVFIGQNYVITLHRGDLKPLVNLFRQCQLDEEARSQNLSGGPGQLLYRIIDRLVDYCLPILNKIGSNIDRVDEEIFSRSMPRAIRDISELRRDVISFRRVIWPLRAVAGSLWPKVRRFTETDMEVYFDDLVDHIDKIWDGLDEYKERIEGLNDTHDSLATNRTNEIVRMLTVIATIMLPITVVASIFGMNIPLGPFGDSRLSALYVSLICLVIIAAMLYFFRRQHWI